MRPSPGTEPEVPLPGGSDSDDPLERLLEEIPEADRERAAELFAVLKMIAPFFKAWRRSVVLRQAVAVYKVDNEMGPEEVLAYAQQLDQWVATGEIPDDEPTAEEAGKEER